MAQPARPNVLLVTADEWRGDCLGIAGHPVLRTPNIDRLAAYGTWFARHYSQAAPCGPARASLYTGLYQMNHRVVRNGTPLDARHDNIALAMRRLGYRPTLFGFTDQSVDPRTVPADSPWLNTYEGVLPGFDVGLRLPENPVPWLDWLEARGHRRLANFWEMYLPVGGNGGRPTRSPPRYSADETGTAFLTDVFLDWLDGRPASEPWFAHVSYLSPHPPYVVPPPFNTLYPTAGGPPFHRAPTPAEEGSGHPLVGYWLAKTGTDSAFPTEPGARMRVADWSDDDFRVLRAVYWGMVAEVDRQFGRILERLAALPGDTIVVLTSDHGEMLGDHWTVGKFGFFDQSFHVPLIVADPRRPGQGRVDAFTEAIDVFPTIVELAGGVPPPQVDGRSLVGWLNGAAPPTRSAVHWEYDFREVATGAAEAALGVDLDGASLAVHREERFKYVHFAGLPPLLFDLGTDPAELVNLADDPRYVAVRLACAEKLLAWRARHLERTLTGMLLTPAGLVDARAPAETPRREAAGEG